MPWDVASVAMGAAATLWVAIVLAEADKLQRRQELAAIAALDEAAAARAPPFEELCLVCLQGCSAADGVVCNGDGRHFICSPCFQRHVERCCSPASSAAFARLGCRVYCPGRRCSAAPSEAASAELAFSDRQIMRRVDDRTWQLLLAARQQAAQARGLRALVVPPPPPPAAQSRLI